MKRRRLLLLAGLGGITFAGIVFSFNIRKLRFFRKQLGELKEFLFHKKELNNLLSTQTVKSDISYPKTAPIFRFVSVADTGTGKMPQYSVARAMKHYHSKFPFGFVVLAGDNIYPNGEIEKINDVFEKPYEYLLENKVKFYACLGNHDVRTDNGEPQVKYPNFNMAGRYYTFEYQPIQFFALDTNAKKEDWEVQLNWLEKELSNSKAPWKIVFAHHPIYSSGKYGSSQKLISTLTPLFKKHKVQLYINGHEHNYERTRPINGTTYLISGAGAKQRPVGRSEWTEYSTENFSFAAFDVYEDRLIVRGINIWNRVFDAGVIQI
ncbi:metallophosphoesterase [Okeania sp.]|uniref:metallophosphoesterase n=1 Tax=Okeania sp. TaxID=3100323 RepID=UPI002B4B711D|nr:metallophosphoesterase [Okeania sp.]MEB3343175.1 metallophosphoesterase [Okeania sp.]